MAKDPPPPGNGAEDSKPSIKAESTETNSSPARVTDEMVKRYASEAFQVADQLGRINAPIQQIAEAMRLHEQAVRRLGIDDAVLKKIQASFDVSKQVTDAMRPKWPDLDAAVGRMGKLIAESASPAKALEGIARPTTYVPPMGPPQEVAATQAVQREIRDLAKIAAATATSIGALAEVARESLEQTVVLIGTVHQLHETSKAAIEASEKSARRIAGTVGDLMDTTDSGLDANYKMAKQLVGVVQQLHDTTQEGITANNRTAKWLIGLTVALIVLTAVIAALTVALLIRTP